MSFDIEKYTRPLIGRPILTRRDREEENLLAWRMTQICNLEKPWEFKKIMKGE